MNRQQLASVLVALLCVTALPLATVTTTAQSGDAFDGRVFSDAATEYGSVGLFSDEVGPDVKKSDGMPVWVVSYDDGTYDSLQEWSAGHNATILSADNESTRAFVAADSVDVGLGGIMSTFADGELAEQGYVNRIDIVLVHGYAAPVDQLENESVYDRPVPNVVAKGFAGDFSAGWEASGIAFGSDANQTTLAEAKDAMNASTPGVDGSGVTVAVIDSGVNTDSANDPLYQNRTTDPYNSLTNTTGYDAVSDGNGHGSWVASAIAADPDPNSTDETYEGVAPGATIMPIKALDDDGSGSTRAIVRGIDWAADNDADVISMSLGASAYSPTIADALKEYLNNGGTAAIVAVGNSRLSATGAATRYVSSPADVPEPGVVGVAAANVSRPDNASVAYFSEVGPDGGVRDGSNGVTNGEGPDVAAPGMRVTAQVTTENGLQQNRTLSGTSMATPLVSGSVALLLDQNPALTNESQNVSKRVQDTARPMRFAGETEAGNGYVDVSALLENEIVEPSQAEVRTETAQGRDVANRAYSGSRVMQLLAESSTVLG